MAIKVYYIPGSHPCNAVFKALDLKGLPFKKVVVIPPAHRLQMKLMFGDRTVPAMKYVDETGRTEKVQTSRAIMRTLDSINPDPPLYPVDADLRRRVLAAESWADGDFQSLGRRLVWAHLARSPQAMLSFSTGDKVPLPKFMQSVAAGPVSWIQAKLNRAGDQQVRDDLASLPALLDRIDGYIADGVIGGEQPNAADLQIGATMQLWMSMDDIRPLVENRPAGKLSLRLFPKPSGHVAGGVLPDEWLAPARAGTPATAH
ncbi:MAG: glutathione S-transferase N-terminal domain-containing protein [Thermoleophilia bacterium]|nr:glutathione S-transferase N-terminal domain-containing protein [Thermoleophilia bacterium]